MSSTLKDRKRKYLQELRRTYTRVDLMIPPEEAIVIQSAARKHGIKVGKLLRVATLAYLNQEFVVPDPEVVRALELQIRRIGTNINQIARAANRSRSVSTQNIEDAFHLLAELEDVIDQAFRHPDQNR